MRLLLFIFLLVVVAAGALLYFDMSDAEVRGAAETINERSASLREGGEQLRSEGDRAIRGQEESLEKASKKTSEKLENLGEKAEDWSQEMRPVVTKYLEAARQRLTGWIEWFKDEFGSG